MALAITTIFLTGCSDSPNAVAEKWTDAIIDGDISRANKYSAGSDSTMMNTFTIEMFKSMDSKEKAEKIKQIKAALKNEAEIDGDEAIISDGEIEIELQKIDGDWKVVSDK